MRGRGGTLFADFADVAPPRRAVQDVTDILGMGVGKVVTIITAQPFTNKTKRWRQWPSGSAFNANGIDIRCAAFLTLTLLAAALAEAKGKIARTLASQGLR